MARGPPASRRDRVCRDADPPGPRSLSRDACELPEVDEQPEHGNGDGFVVVDRPTSPWSLGTSSEDVVGIGVKVVGLGRADAREIWDGGSG